MSQSPITHGEATVNRLGMPKDQALFGSRLKIRLPHLVYFASIETWSLHSQTAVRSSSISSGHTSLCFRLPLPLQTLLFSILIRARLPPHSPNLHLVPVPPGSLHQGSNGTGVGDLSLLNLKVPPVQAEILPHHFFLPIDRIPCQVPRNRRPSQANQ